MKKTWFVHYEVDGIGLSGIIEIEAKSESEARKKAQLHLKNKPLLLVPEYTIKLISENAQ